MRQIVIDELYKIKTQEGNFQSDWWINNYFSETGKKSDHISVIYFEELTDEDLLRCYTYVLLERNDISEKRVKETYFKN